MTSLEDFFVKPEYSGLPDLTLQFNATLNDEIIKIRSTNESNWSDLILVAELARIVASKYFQTPKREYHLITHQNFKDISKGLANHLGLNTPDLSEDNSNTKRAIYLNAVKSSSEVEQKNALAGKRIATGLTTFAKYWYASVLRYIDIEDLDSIIPQPSSGKLENYSEVIKKKTMINKYLKPDNPKKLQMLELIRNLDDFQTLRKILVPNIRILNE
jgi:hypothetical protein